MRRTLGALALLGALGSAALGAACGGGGGITGSGGGTTTAGTGGSESGGGGAGGSAGTDMCPAPAEPAALLAEAQQRVDEARARRLSMYEALFGLAADGTIAPGGLDDIDWDPSHDSVVFHSLDAERNVPLLISNDAVSAAGPTDATLALGAEIGGFRYALLGANALSDLALDPPSPGTPRARMKDFARRLIAWLLGKDPGSGAGQKIVLAQLADSYWFKHDEGTAEFFATELPGASVNAPDTCESGALAGCLDGASLLVISDQDTDDDDDNPTPADPALVMKALDAAKSAKIPVLYVQYDGDLTPLGERMMRFFRTATSDNYWEQERLAGFSPALLLDQKDELAALGSLTATIAKGTLAVGDYASCIDDAHRFADCASPAFVEKIGKGAGVLRDTLGGLDQAGADPFAEEGYALLRALIRLGEAYRTGALDYPIPFDKDAAAFARGILADSSVHYAGPCNRAQAHLGTYVCDRSALLAGSCAMYDPSSIARDAATVEEPFLPDSEWTSTGLYALPGMPITVERKDAGPGAVAVRFGFQREGTTRSMETGSGGTRYDRPAYLASPWISVESGKPLTLSTPYGGPIYLSLDGAKAQPGDKAKLAFGGVAHHAALLDVGDDVEVASFIAGVSKNPLPHVDLRGHGFEVHLRKDKLLGGVTAPYTIATRADGSPVVVDYKGDLSLFLGDFRDNYLAPEYAMAGFAPPGKTLAGTLSADVQAICAHLGWACTDAGIHARASIQHANYDQYAACGDGCSGNPFDADWSITPLGWGESHELGHNLQTGLLQIGYVAEADRNDHPKYQGRAGENSNNIFPYHNLYRYLRTVKGEQGAVADDHMSLKTLYAMVQSARAGLTRVIGGQSRKVVFDDQCKVVGDYPLSAVDVQADAIWKDGGYAATNGPRMGFYLQLPLRLAGATMTGGTVLHDGFDIFTLLYAETRLVRAAAESDASWDAQKSALGFDLFPRTGHPTYGGGSVRDMPGNDFLLVALSHLSRLDFRPYFKMMGVETSDLASSQIDAFVASGLVAGKVPEELFVLDTDLPGVDLTAVETVAADGAAVWPRDGFHPSSCP
ncbi:MAG: ImpA family metalloprotease [Byssovorax sp.]